MEARLNQLTRVVFKIRQHNGDLTLVTSLECQSSRQSGGGGDDGGDDDDEDDYCVATQLC